jgi:YHS domain-containing protein
VLKVSYMPRAITKSRVAFDPACGERLRPDRAVRREVRGEIRFFCSVRCADAFAAAPHRFEDEEYADRVSEPR